MRNRTFTPGLTNVPDFDASLASGVHVLGGVGNGDGTDNFTMTEGVDLSCVTGNPRSDEGVRWKWHRLHLAVGGHVEGVCSATIPPALNKRTVGR